EADRPYSLDAGAFLEGVDRGGRVGLHAVDARPRDVLHVAELVVTRPEAGAAAEVVDRDRAVARLREALGQLDVEAVQPAYVREDHDGDVARVGAHGKRDREAVAVRGGELERLGGRAARDRREGEIGRE